MSTWSRRFDPPLPRAIRRNRNGANGRQYRRHRRMGLTSLDAGEMTNCMSSAFETENALGRWIAMCGRCRRTGCLSLNRRIRVVVQSEFSPRGGRPNFRHRLWLMGGGWLAVRGRLISGRLGFGSFDCFSRERTFIRFAFQVAANRLECVCRTTFGFAWMFDAPVVVSSSNRGFLFHCQLLYNTNCRRQR